MTIPIIGISYKTKISKKNKIRVTVCKIKWINPANGNIQCSYGNAMCNPNDTFKESIGQQIAESRAKRIIYQTYWNYITHIVKPIHDKFHSLAINERKHEKDIIDNLK